MSKEAALAFLKKAAENEEMQKKIVALALSEGYEFSVQDLSEAELEQVAGGFLKLETLVTRPLLIPTEIKWTTP